MGAHLLIKKRFFHIDQRWWSSVVKRGGFIILMAWILRIAVVPAEAWSLWDGATFLLLVIGGVILARPTATSCDSTSAVHVLPNDYGVFRLLLKTLDREYQWAGKTLAELNLRKRDLLVLAIQRGDDVIPFPKGPEVIVSGDELLIFGRAREFKAMGDAKLGETNGT